MILKFTKTWPKFVRWIFVSMIFVLIVVAIFYGMDHVRSLVPDLDEWSWKRVALLCTGMISFAILVK